jgi:hypothetical protein
MTQELVTRWSSRKFWTMTVSQVFICSAFLAGRLSEDGFIALTIFILGSYLSANVVQHVMEKK